MNHIGVSPTRTKPISYNPLRAGQFRGYGGCNVIPSRTTIINNNNIFMGGYGNYNCCQDTSLTTGEKWMLGLGVGTGLLGTILSLFGIGKNTEKGGVEPETTTQNQTSTPAETTTTTSTTPTTTSTSTPATAPTETEAPTTPEQNNSAKIDYSFIKDGAQMTCTDLSGKTQDITGTLSQVTKDANGVPTSFVLTDSGSDNRYKYEVKIASDGTITYNCVSKNETPVVGEHNYTLKDGKLVQEDSNYKGFGFGITTKSAAKPAKPATHATTTSTPATPETPAAENKFTTKTPYYDWNTGEYKKYPEAKETKKEATKGTNNSPNVENAENKLKTMTKFALNKARETVKAAKLTDTQKENYQTQINQLVIQYSGNNEAALQSALSKIMNEVN